MSNMHILPRYKINVNKPLNIHGSLTSKAMVENEPVILRGSPGSDGSELRVSALVATSTVRGGAGVSSAGLASGETLGGVVMVKRDSVRFMIPLVSFSNDWLMASLWERRSVF